MAEVQGEKSDGDGIGQSRFTLHPSALCLLHSSLQPQHIVPCRTAPPACRPETWRRPARRGRSNRGCVARTVSSSVSPSRPNDDGVFARVVAGAHGVVADFVVRPLAGPTLRGRGGARVMSHRVGDDLAELQRRAAGGIFFEAVMPLDDLDIGPAGMIFRAPGRRFPRASSPDSPPGSCWGTTAAGSFSPPRGAAACCSDSSPVVATTSGIFRSRHVCKIAPVPAGIEKSITTSTGFRQRGSQRHADRAHAGHRAGILPELRMARRFQRGDDFQVRHRPRPAPPAAAPCGRRRRGWRV